MGCGKQGLPGVYVNNGYYENWIRDTINELEKGSEESEEAENAFNFGQAGRVLNEMNSNTNINSNGNMALATNSNSDDNENQLYEPASIINERSNSQVVNGTESDELVLSGSFTEAPTKLNKTSTSN